ncbi:MAG: hypothetical protein ACYS8W_10345 [Planctomycetota bacterium]|jgi:hypothetical protein
MRNFPALIFSVILVAIAAVSLSCSRGGGSDNIYVPSTNTNTNTGTGTPTGTGTGTDTGTDTSTATGTDTTSGVTFNMSDYYDFTEGNYWTFDNTTMLFTYWANAATTLHTYDVQPMTLVYNSSGTLWRVDNWSVTTGPPIYIAWQLDAGNTADYDYFDPPLRYGLDSMTVGTIWNDSGVRAHTDGSSNSSYTCDWTFLGPMPAYWDNGTEIPNTIAIEQKLSYGGPVYTYHMYYAPGSWLVMSESLDSGGSITGGLYLVDTNALKP